MTVPKWTEERTAALQEKVNGLELVSRDLVAQIAQQLNTTTRSISAKLRKLDVNVEKVSEAPKAFDEETTQELRDFVEANEGAYTYAQIAENFSGDYSARAIQGKLLSMELTGMVKPTPKKESVKTFTDEEEATVIAMVKAGNFVQQIAEKVGKSVQSTRGKALNLLKQGQIDAMPKQEFVKEAAADVFASIEDISSKTVAELMAIVDKTERGVKTMLTRRGLSAADYNSKQKDKSAA